MGSRNYPLRQVGIYRNLPTFDPSIKNLSAVVCGASGISGFNTLRSLLSSPERWSTVYTLSRNKISDKALQLLAPEQRACIKHISIDLASPALEIARALQENQVHFDYVFFYSYTQGSVNGMDPGSAEALIKLNVPLLQNFLEALPLAHIEPKRILLQTGGKNYGVHIGRARTPHVESDPQPKHLAKNFYYEQEPLLFDFCKQHPRTHWNVIRPAAIIGAAPNVVIAMFLSFAAYAVVQREKGEPLYFGGDFDSWQFEAAHSTAQLTGYLSEWAVLEDECADQAFNAQDGSPLSWDRFFHELARWFGVDGVVGPEQDEKKYHSIAMVGGKDAPLGYGPALTLRRSFALSEWAKLDENKDIWQKVMRQNECSYNPWDGNLNFNMGGDFCYLTFGTLSQNKMRRFGFSGFVDSLESIFEMYQEMAKIGILPPMKVDKAIPLV